MAPVSDVKGSAEAFCPAHITGLFVIRDGPEDPVQKGSLGAGICLKLGARSRVDLVDGECSTTINGNRVEAPVTASVVDRLLGGGMGAVVETRLDLPMGQGFGMSGAGALSTALALREAMVRSGMTVSMEAAYQAAHIAEVENLSGLGDVPAQLVGGMPLRRIPGPPPWGDVVSMEDGAGVQVVLVVVSGPLSTREVLSDPRRRAAIDRSGGSLLEELAASPGTDRMMELSMRFARESGLMSPEVERVCEALRELGPASMCMLGNSVFCIPERPTSVREVRELTDTRECYVTAVSPEGAGLV